jgi:hypothetical protein
MSTLKETGVASKHDLDQSALVKIVKNALELWAAPSPVGQAYRRFLDGIRRHPEGAESPLPRHWRKAYQRLLTEVRDVVTHTHAHHWLVSDGVREAIKYAGLLDQLYGPANDLFLREDHRYSLEWTYRDSTQTAGSDSASKATGKVHVVNVLSPMPPVFDPNGAFSGGTAHAGVGFLFRPQYALTKLKMTPSIAYRFNYLIDHSSPETLSIAKTRGFVRLLAFKVNLFLKTSELVAEWDKPLWDATNQPIASRHEQQQSGTFTGFPVQLEFTASSDFFYAACCVATVYVNRGYYGGRDKPPEPTLCTGNLECDISAMWLEQEKLA